MYPPPSRPGQVQTGGGWEGGVRNPPPIQTWPGPDTCGGRWGYVTPPHPDLARSRQGGREVGVRTPSPLFRPGQVQMGGRWGYIPPPSGPGQVPPPWSGQQKERWLCGGRYASCVHAGGLSCLRIL